jgi:hypothetical protein
MEMQRLTINNAQQLTTFNRLEAILTVPLEHDNSVHGVW